MGRIIRRRIGVAGALPAAEEFVLALTVAAGDVGASVEAVLSAHGLTARQYHALRMLRGAGAGGLAHRDIGRRLLARAPDVTRLMDQLIDRGWVERTRAEHDARIVLHRLTSGGAEILASVAGPLQARYQRIAKALGPGSVKQIVLLCEQVIDIVAAQRADAV